MINKRRVKVPVRSYARTLKRGSYNELLALVKTRKACSENQPRVIEASTKHIPVHSPGDEVTETDVVSEKETMKNASKKQKSSSKHSKLLDNKIQREALQRSSPGDVKNESLTLNVNCSHVNLLEIQNIKDASQVNFRQLKFKVRSAKCKLILKVMEDMKHLQTKENDWDLLWCGTSKLTSQDFRALRPHQKINRIPGMTEITRKDCLARNLTRMAQLYGRQSYGFFPETFVFPDDEKTFIDFAEQRKRTEQDTLWIVKPVSSSQGRGIFVTDQLSNVPRTSGWLVSRYIDNPCLIHSKKFDIRIYVVITSIDPLRIYIHEEGLVRIATEPYSIRKKFLGNRFIHLTNYSINKRNTNFVENKRSSESDHGNKWSLKKLRFHLKSHGINDDEVMERIEDLTIKTVLSMQRAVISESQRVLKYRNNCFSLLGLDILLDSNLKPWLLEINQNPSLSCSTPLDHAIKRAVVCDMLSLVGIKQNNSPGSTSLRKRKPKRSTDGEADIEHNNELFKSTRNIVNPSLWVWSMHSSNVEVEELTSVFIKETQQEEKRSGRFRTLFPSPKWHLHRPFFEGCRELTDAVCQAWRLQRN